MKKEIKKIVLNFSEINKKCDSDFQKLSNKCKNFELSHNRKIKLLSKIEKLLKHNALTPEWQAIKNQITKELNSMCRMKGPFK